MKFKDKYVSKGKFLIVALMSIHFGCKKLVEIDPPLSSMTSKAVFNDDVTATSVLTGLYAQLSNQNAMNSNSIMGISFYTGLSADELSVLPGNADATLNAYYRNQLVSGSSLDLPSWGALYGIVNAANYAIEGLQAQPTKEIESSSNLTSVVKNQLLGEAKFMRAFCYFYLTNLYGDVPLVLSSDFKQGLTVPRTAKALIYQQMVKDLIEAKQQLNKNFTTNNLITTSTERVRPTYWAAAALLARVYLYKGNDYMNAEVNASEVIANSNLFNLTTLDQVFLKNSKEAIWQLQPVTTGWNTNFGRHLILVTAPSLDPYANPVKPFFLNENLVKSFEANDPRKTKWINSITNNGTTYYFPFKYKKGANFEGSVVSSGVMTEYTTVLRLSELFLIRAEARFMQNNTSGSISDLNAVRLRARDGKVGILPDISINADLEKAIAKERQVELFTEWGDRWLNLKRTGKVDEVMSVITPQKSGQNWKPYQVLYPLVQEDIRMNPSLVQNPGYN